MCVCAFMCYKDEQCIVVHISTQTFASFFPSNEEGKSAGPFYLYTDCLPTPQLQIHSNARSETGNCLLILWLNMRFRIRSTTEDHRRRVNISTSFTMVVQRKMKSFLTAPHRICRSGFCHIRVSVDRDVSIDLLKCQDVSRSVYFSRLSFVMSLYLRSTFAVVTVRTNRVAESMCARVNGRASPR